MGYLKIPNLYRDTDILLFKRCYALEKIDGTSTHVFWKNGQLSFSSGGVQNHQAFVDLFDAEFLARELPNYEDIEIYGEAYGGKIQGMSKRYGTELRFIVFDVKIHDLWLSVDKAQKVANDLGLEFVDYEEIPAEINEINRCRDKESTQALRNGMGSGHKSEGVVLRPLLELTKNNGDRIISKHKREEERETASPREIGEDKLKLLTEAQAVADEWVTEKRLEHVLNKMKPPFDITQTGEVIRRMKEDIKLESEKEVLWSKDVENAIGKSTAIIFKRKVNRLPKEE